jgi:hypothetical protein
MSAKDTNYRSYADLEDVRIPDYTRFDPTDEGLDPRDYADVLKFSHAERVAGVNLTVVGGKENAIDMNRRCRDIFLSDVTLCGGDQSSVVIKGATENVILRRFTYFVSKKAWCEVLIGDWSDQSTEPSRNIVLDDHYRKDGKPVRVVVGRAEWPYVVGGNVRICYVKSYALKAYFWAKYFAVRLGIVKLPA